MIVLITLKRLEELKEKERMYDMCLIEWSWFTQYMHGRIPHYLSILQDAKNLWNNTVFHRSFLNGNNK